MTWTQLGIISIVILIIFRTGPEIKIIPNAVWAGLAIGLFVGFLVTTFSLFKGEFNWHAIVKAGIIGEMIGLGLELLGRFSDMFAKR